MVGDPWVVKVGRVTLWWHPGGRSGREEGQKQPWYSPWESILSTLTRFWVHYYWCKGRWLDWAWNILGIIPRNSGQFLLNCSENCPKEGFHRQDSCSEVLSVPGTDGSVAISSIAVCMYSEGSEKRLQVLDKWRTFLTKDNSKGENLDNVCQIWGTLQDCTYF